MAAGDSDRRQIEEIKSRIDIVDFLSRYIEVKPAGKNYKAVCPFHNEKTPSFMISPELQRYKCFGCGVNGDIFTFLTEHEHIDFVEALEQLAKEAGVQLEKRGKSRNKHLDILEMINSLAAIYYHKQLKSSAGNKAKEYLKSRDITKESIDSFQLGYAPGGKSLYSHIMTKAKFSKSQLISSGLFGEKDGSIKDKFYDERVIFPIRNSRGKVIAFNGRIMPGIDFGPKYLHSPETPLFHKKETVFGLYKARKALRKEDLAILCEGATDVISCHQNHIDNIVAPLGTALTEEQVQSLSKYTKNILLFFDNDSAGQKAVERGFLICTKVGVNSFAANTGKYKDLDEAVRDNSEFVKKAIKSKQDAFTYLISRKLNQTNLEDLSQYKNFIKYVGILLQHVETADDLSFFLNKVQKLSGIQKNVFSSAVDSIKGGKFRPPSLNNPTPQEDKSDNSQINPLKNFEYYLLGIILQSGKYSLLKSLKIHTKYFSNKTVTSILQAINKLRKKGEVTIELITNEIENDTNLASVFENLVLDSQISHFVENTADINKECEKVYNRIKKEYLEKKRQKLRSQLLLEEENPNSESESINSLSQEIQKLTRRMNKLM
ncbi:DNA primase [Candidatus Dojkabacteria bacterium]|nr:DNA primase [Candidatus Dojkabacteria bacterium]